MTPASCLPCAQSGLALALTALHTERFVATLRADIKQDFGAVMGRKTEPLCKWKKDDIADQLDTLKKMVCDARFICKRCGRAADKKKHLCKPESLDK
jgi:hypothetical protein